MRGAVFDLASFAKFTYSNLQFALRLHFMYAGIGLMIVKPRQSQRMKWTQMVDHLAEYYFFLV